MSDEARTAYRERAALVALLASLALRGGYKAGLGEHDPTDATWDPAWRTIVFVELPRFFPRSAEERELFQASWHIADEDRDLVAFLPTYEGAWNGHTTEEKYALIAELALAALRDEGV